MIVENWDVDLFDLMEHGSTYGQTVHENQGQRVSNVLGPDGENLVIIKPRHQIGFNLKPKRS